METKLKLDAMNFNMSPSESDSGLALPGGTFADGDDGRDRVQPEKNRYGPEVLINHWYDERAVYVPPPDDWASVYKRSYLCPENKNFLQDRKTQKETKHKIERGLGMEFLIQYYGKTFRDNYTTTNDLVYRILPKDLCGPRLRKYYSRKDAWLPQWDLSKIYGNLTSYGFQEIVKCQDFLESLPEPRESCLKNHYKKHEIKPMKRFPKGQGYQNIPHLEHLDIDPDKPFRPHLLPMCKPKSGCPC